MDTADTHRHTYNSNSVCLKIYRPHYMLGLQMKKVC